MDHEKQIRRINNTLDRLSCLHPCKEHWEQVENNLKAMRRAYEDESATKTKSKSNTGPSNPPDLRISTSTMASLAAILQAADIPVYSPGGERIDLDSFIPKK